MEVWYLFTLRETGRELPGAIKSNLDRLVHLMWMLSASKLLPAYHQHHDDI